MIHTLSPAQRAVLLTGFEAADSIEWSPEPSRPVVVSPAELRALATWSASERLPGLVSSAVRSGDLVVDDEAPPVEVDAAKSALDDAVVSTARSSLAAEATGVRAVLALRDAGIEAVVFKGMAAAHLDYDDPTERSFFDADILVARHDLLSAVDLLAQASFHRANPAVMSPWWERRFARAVELRESGGVELDLHAALATGYFGVVLDHDLVRRDLVEIDLGGVPCTAFGPTSRLLISCYAIVLSRGPNLRLYADLARQLLVTGSDWQQAAAWAGEGEAVVAEALRRTGSLVGVNHPALSWAPGVGATPDAERGLALADRAHTSGWSADARSAINALGAADRGRFVAGLLASRVRRWR